METKLDTATFAGGCFWCTEAVFKRLNGVYKVVPGYSGGEKENPSYKDVCSGKTGYVESIQVKFNPQEIPYWVLLEVFWHTHDPTSLNRQGNDVGTQYRSVIFYHSDRQKAGAIKSRDELKKENIYKDPIVTEILPFKNFYFAENYHKDYYDQNRNYPYCTFVIDPKIQKLMEKYSKLIKEGYLNS